jgi:hypothetical protein
LKRLILLSKLFADIVGDGLDNNIESWLALSANGSGVIVADACMGHQV